MKVRFSGFMTLCDTALGTYGRVNKSQLQNLHLDQTQFLWRCYGDSMIASDLWYRDDAQDWSISVVHGGLENRVYEYQVWDNVNEWYGRWIDPEYKHAYYADAFERQIEPNMACDGVEFTDFEYHSDLYEYAYELAEGRQKLSQSTDDDDDDLETIALDLNDSELALIARAAHAEDITINEFVVKALKIKLDEVMPEWRAEVRNGYTSI